MSLLSDWWLPATPPTTMSTSISPSQMPRHDGSGSPRSTKWSRSTHAPLSRHISALKTTTVPGSSNRHGSTSAISTAWQERRQPLRSCTKRCWRSIRTGSILGGRSGVRHALSSHESDEFLKKERLHDQENRNRAIQPHHCQIAGNPSRPNAIYC